MQGSPQKNTKYGDTMKSLRVAHYLNQFFAGVGGEDKADIQPQMKEGAVGPGQFLAKTLGDTGKVVTTVYCGDNYVNENPEDATGIIINYIEESRPDVVIAGPAFDAGRYGMACGMVCSAVQDRLSLPTVTGMYHENPAVEAYRRNGYIVPTAAAAIGMRDALTGMARLAIKLGSGEVIASAAEEGYISHGLRYTELADLPGSVRAADMLAKRLKGQEFLTEWPTPVYDQVPPAPPIKELSKATIAIVTSGGIVPKGNPDRLESTFASKWLKYDIASLDALDSAAWESVHGGYDTSYAREDPNRVAPLDVMRGLERDGVIGRLFDNMYVTVGSGASITSAKKFGEQISHELAAAQVDGVILVAT